MSTQTEASVATDLARDLAERERQLAAVERLAQVGFWEWTIATDTVIWSDELYRMFGHEPDAFEPNYGRWLAAIHPDDREATHQMVQRAFETRESYAFDHRVLHPDGTVRILHGRGNVECDADGEPVRIVGVTSDVTERRRNDQQLHALIADAAHQLRTPLAALQSGVDVLSQPGVPPQLLDGAVAAMARQIDQLRILANTMLELEALRPEAGPLMTLPIRVSDAVAVAVSELPAAHRAALTIDVDTDVYVRATEHHLARMISALLSNAFTHGGRSVVVRVAADGFDATVEVTDDGPGVDPEVATHLFTPFARGRATPNGGTGLGLTLVKRLAESLGGSVTHHRVEPHGARFTVTMENVDAHPAG